MAPCPAEGYFAGGEPIFSSSFTHGWETTKEPARGLYWATSPPLAVEPFRTLSPLGDTGALETLLFLGERAEQEEQEEAARTATSTAVPLVSLMLGRGDAQSPTGPLRTD